MNSVDDRIQSLVERNKVLLFMKGSRTIPMCGFSAAIIQVLDRVNVPYETVDVLEDPEIREGVKSFSNWPTIPQLYVDGKFLGGCDIVRDMDAKGELAPLLRGSDEQELAAPVNASTSFAPLLRPSPGESVMNGTAARVGEAVPVAASPSTSLIGTTRTC